MFNVRNRYSEPFPDYAVLYFESRDIIGTYNCLIDRHNKLIAICHPKYIEEGHISSGWRTWFYLDGRIEMIFIDGDKHVNGFWYAFDPWSEYEEIEQRVNGDIVLGVFKNEQKEEFEMF